jgi:Holliday junction DNA helicase RuvA
MIGKITGNLEYKGHDHALIDVNGIGYEIFLSDRSLISLPKIGSKVAIFTELIVREDLLQLVGFVSINEREWYRLLTSVQGVGSKAALKILGSIMPSALSRAILIGDADTVKAAPGIGPKIAQRIVVELKDKASALMAMGSEFKTVSKTDSIGIIEAEDEISDLKENLGKSGSQMSNFSLEVSESLQAEALSALANLGYARAEAAVAITNVLMIQVEPIGLSKLIHLSLKELGSRE